jgi:Reverse transcriptase (RNA-dependent DNA polymerase)
VELLHKSEITVFTETKLDDSATTASLLQDGYDINRADRTNYGGGVATFISISLKPVVLEDIQNKFIKQGLEVTVNSIELAKPIGRLIILGVYRPPNSAVSWFTKFNELLVEVLPLGLICILGDLNADLLKPNSYPGKTLRVSLKMADTKVAKVSPTRISSSCASCLDIVATPTSLNCTSYETGLLAASDHLPVIASIAIADHLTLEPVKKRSFNSINYAELKKRVGSIQLSQTVDSTPEDLLELWQDSLMSILDDVAPVKLYPNRRKKPSWMNENITRLISMRNVLARKLLKVEPGSEEAGAALAELKEMRKRTKSNIRAAVRSQGMKMLADRDTKNVWRFMREVTFTTPKGQKTTMDLSTLNVAFGKTVKASHDTALVMLPGCDNLDSFNFQALTTSDVRNMLQSIKEHTATGPDEIPAKLLKRLANAVSPQLTQIMNLSIAHSSFPAQWKEANVIPIWKSKGSKSDPSNYRPISILPVLARMAEKACAKQLSRFCEERRVVPDQQFGFRARSGCEQALIAGTNTWMGEVDEGKFVGAMLVDLSKAFDTVPHQLLLAELRNIGCSSQALQWFHSYLSGRRQRVAQSTVVTDWIDVSRGVPQGSCLSPLLFNIFVRDLPHSTQTQTIQFADDVTNSAADHDPRVVGQKLIDSYYHTKTFCESHELVINADKTQLIFFKTPGKKLPTDYELILDGCSIKPSTFVKLLGVTLDTHFTFKEHFDNIVRKCHGLLGVLTRASPFLSRDLLRLAYISLIRSHLEYCSAIFAPAAPTQLKKLDTVQKIAARIICGAPRDAHSEPLLQALRLDTLESRRKNHIIDLVRSIVQGDCHPALQNHLTVHSDGRLISKLLPSRIGIGNKRFYEVARTHYNAELGAD